ncbi:hypothetical protein V1478_004032 [Vespula squamosa]|uniref:Uncharacterized protein n=1 Tax=Vespula squamosa TaxID=30214 RepID=A0ABD2BNI5_VESSQ
MKCSVTEICFLLSGYDILKENNYSLNGNESNLNAISAKYSSMRKVEQLKKKTCNMRPKLMRLLRVPESRLALLMYKRRREGVNAPMPDDDKSLALRHSLAPKRTLDSVPTKNKKNPEVRLGEGNRKQKMSDAYK